MDLNSAQQADHLLVAKKNDCHDSRLFLVNLWVMKDIQTIKFAPGIN